MFWSPDKTVHRQLTHALAVYVKGLQRFQPINTYSLFQMKTLQPIETNQRMISRCFNTYLFRHFNPCLEHFKPVHLSFTTTISKTSQLYIEDISTHVKPFFHR